MLGLCVGGEEGTSVECPTGICTKGELFVGGGPSEIVRFCGVFPVPETGNSLTGNEVSFLLSWRLLLPPFCTWLFRIYYL